MDVRKLNPGSAAPNGSDVIKLTLLKDGKSRVTAVFGGEKSDLGTYETAEAGQRAGINHAVGQATFPLYIEIIDADRT